MADNWFYSRDGAQREGPVGEHVLRQLLASMQLRPTDLVWRPGMNEWTPAANVPEFAGGAVGAAPQVAVGSPDIAAAGAAPSFIPPQQLVQSLSYAQSPGSGELLCTTRTLELLRATRPWVRFISILIMIVAGFCLLIGVAVLVTAARVMPLSRGGPFFGAFASFIYFLFAAVNIMPALYLSRYASRITDLLQTRREDKLEEAIEAQKSYWKFIGIFTLVVICLYLLMLLIVMLIAVSR